VCASLVEACSKYIQKFFAEVAQSEEFLLMEQKDIVEILSNDELHVSSEEQVLHVVILFSDFLMQYYPCCWCCYMLLLLLGVRQV